MKSVYPQFFVIFFVLGFSFEAEDAPTNLQKLAKAPVGQADGNGPPKIQKVSAAGKAFVIFIEKLINRKDARTACTRIGGALATLKNYKDFDLISSIFQGDPNIAYWFWLGGRLNGTGPNWREKYIWDSGEPIPSSFLYWWSSEPDSKSKDCLMLRMNKRESYVLRNGVNNKNALATHKCDLERSAIDGYICEV